MPRSHDGRGKPAVLHLAYEDPCAPGSGGGSVRTREINERLACDFDITVVSVPFPGSEPRQDAGVRYEHLGTCRGGKFVRQIAYFSKLPSYVRRQGSSFDLVVEDFGAPVGSVGIPRYTDTPVIGLVQWLFAAQKAQQYHLPFKLVEDFGLRSHRRLIAVSRGMANDIRDRNPAAEVDVVENGLADEAFAWRGRRTRSDILYLGRLDVVHKGLDLLLEAFGAVRDRITQNLDIAGDGEGDGWLRDEIQRRSLGDRVRLVGRVDYATRFEMLSGYDAVVMPSRYESFGMVAAEAAAVGTPVVVFDINCLRDLVPACLRVEAFDVDAYAAKLVAVCGSATLRAELGRTLPGTVRHLSWDSLADRQAEIYAEMVRHRGAA